MLKFSDKMRNGQSSWMVNVYEQIFKDKSDGFLVEIGVGEVLDWTEMGFLSSTGSGPVGYFNNKNSDRILDWDVDWDSGKIVQGGSHTIELIQQGWTGIYIEPLREFIDNELEPLFKKTLSKEHFDKIKFVRCGASNKKKLSELLQYETLVDSNDVDSLEETKQIQPYNYQGRKVMCEKTSVILEQHNCPHDIDFMLIDAEGSDIDVINGIDFDKHLPKVILVETMIVGKDNVSNALPNFYIEAVNDGLNTLYVHENFYKSPLLIN